MWCGQRVLLPSKEKARNSVRRSGPSKREAMPDMSDSIWYLSLTSFTECDNLDKVFFN